MKSVDRLQIHPKSAQLEGTPTSSPTYIRVHAVLWKYSEGQTNKQMVVTSIHFATATPYANCSSASTFAYVWQ